MTGLDASAYATQLAAQKAARKAERRARISFWFGCFTLLNNINNFQVPIYWRLYSCLHPADLTAVPVCTWPWQAALLATAWLLVQVGLIGFCCHYQQGKKMEVLGASVFVVNLITDVGWVIVQRLLSYRNA